MCKVLPEARYHCGNPYCVNGTQVAKDLRYDKGSGWWVCPACSLPTTSHLTLAKEIELKRTRNIQEYVRTHYEIIEQE